MKKTKATGALGGAEPVARSLSAGKAGCVQPHGVVFILDAATGVVRQASANTGELLGVPAAALLGESLDILGGDLASQVRLRLRERVGSIPGVFFGTTRVLRGGARGVAGTIHRNRDGVVVLEAIPSPLPDASASSRELPQQLATAIDQLGAATRLSELAGRAADAYRELTGYERVIVYRLPISGFGEVLGESRDGQLDSWLGVGLADLDALGRATNDAFSSRVRALADAAAFDVPLMPPLLESIGSLPDLGRASLAAATPTIREHVRGAGARAGFVSLIVRSGEPWGVVVGYHSHPRQLTPALHSACDLLSELTAARVAVIENFARVAAASSVRRLDEHLLAKTLSGGMWQETVLEDARDLLALVGADGLALMSDGQVRRAGDAPSEAALHSLALWLASQPTADGVIARDSLPVDVPDMAGVGATCAGLLAVELSRPGGEFLLWFRREAIRDIRAQGGASHSTRGECRPWSGTDVASAKAVAAALRDVSVQVRSMSYLLVEDRLENLSQALQGSDEGILIADGAGKVRFMNQAFRRFFELQTPGELTLADLPAAFGDSPAARSLVESVLEQRQSWQGELALHATAERPATVAVRAEVIPRLEGFGALGFILLATSLAARDADESARARAREAIRAAQEPLATMRLHPLAAPSPASLVVLTDGQANVARDGSGGRQRAGEEARQAARLLRAAGTRSVVIDTAQRPQPLARQLADDMGARYVPLPHAGARAISEAARLSA